MIHVEPLIRWFMTVMIVASLTLAGWLAYENHTQLKTISELVHMVNIKLDSMEATSEVILRMNGELPEALRVGGSVAVARQLQRGTEK